MDNIHVFVCPQCSRASVDDAYCEDCAVNGVIVTLVPVTRLRALEADLLALTPGGSEFHGSPERCLEFIRDRLGTVVEQVKKRKDAESEAEKALERSGIVGIYAEFAGLADAINQLASHVQELERRKDAVEIEAHEMRRALEQIANMPPDGYGQEMACTMADIARDAALTGQPEREGG